MAAYYNEIDPAAAAWLRELVRRGLVAPGDVDERSISDVRADDLRGYGQHHFFAGIGGWSHALRLAGWPDDRPVWTGSCPCQPFSAAGAQRGSDDERHLWPAFFGLIRECRPATVFGEQVAGAAGYAWWDHVAADLEGEAYAAAACDIGAHSGGAPHIRQRLYWVGMANADGRNASTEGIQRSWKYGQQSQDGGTLYMADADGAGSLLGQCDCEPAQPAQQAPRGHDIDGRGEVFGVGESRRTGLEGRLTPGQLELQGSPEPIRPAGASGALDSWVGADWISCADGKARPAQSGIFPLVDGLPEGLVRGGDRRLAPDADASAEARVMRLRGYGNAIVPQVAAAFIRAVPC